MAHEEHWHRLQSGRITTFTTPEMMMESLYEYCKWSKENPIVIRKVLTSGKEAGKEVLITKTRPYSIQAFCLGCGILPEYLRDLTKTKAKDSKWYLAAVTIVNVIRTQNIEYAMIDEFNPIFTAKILGLEKEEAPTGAVKVEIVREDKTLQLSNSENELLEKLDLEKREAENALEQNSQEQNISAEGSLE